MNAQLKRQTLRRLYAFEHPSPFLRSGRTFRCSPLGTQTLPVSSGSRADYQPLRFRGLSSSADWLTCPTTQDGTDSSNKRQILSRFRKGGRSNNRPGIFRGKLRRRGDTIYRSVGQSSSRWKQQNPSASRIRSCSADTIASCPGKTDGRGQARFRYHNTNQG